MTSSTERNAVFLHEMGLGPIWTRRDSTAVGNELQTTVQEDYRAVSISDVQSAWASEEIETSITQNDMVPPLSADAHADIAQMSWDELRQAVAGCTRCGLCRNRTKTVFGVGDEKAKWLFVGEGPGRNEDLQGEPFVGPAGKLLDNMLIAIGVRRGVNTYIANVVKCRPTDENGRDRAPTPQEVAACMPYLQRQIALIQPTVIVALGKTAALALLGADPATPVSKLRGTVHQYAGHPLIVTYHPAYLLRNPVDKRKTWADLCLAMAAYGNAG